jgi:SAM-dependent methyltransferase
VSEVIWHDLECGRYAADLPLWRALADEEAGPILDLGAGSGRVALDLARHGHAVTALDTDAELLAALAARAAAAALDGEVRTVRADARDFSLDGERFGLILVPMQTVQLLGGADGRVRMLRAARAHLAPGGLCALALADAFEGFDAQHTQPPAADVARIDGVLYSSRPIAVRDEGTAVAIDRRRETLDGAGTRTAEASTVRLDHLDGPTLEDEAQALGFAIEPERRIPQTDEHVGSTVVVLRG